MARWLVAPRGWGKPRPEERHRHRKSSFLARDKGGFVLQALPTPRNSIQGLLGSTVSSRSPALLGSQLSVSSPLRGSSAVSLLPPEAGLPVAAAREALGRRSKKERPPGAPPALGPQTWYEERRHHLIQLPAGSPGVTDLTCLELSILGP